jgi:hypothetical protein
LIPILFALDAIELANRIASFSTSSAVALTPFATNLSTISLAIFCFAAFPNPVFFNIKSKETFSKAY